MNMQVWVSCCWRHGERSWIWGSKWSVELFPNFCYRLFILWWLEWALYLTELVLGLPKILRWWAVVPCWVWNGSRKTFCHIRISLTFFPCSTCLSHHHLSYMMNVRHELKSSSCLECDQKLALCRISAFGLCHPSTCWWCAAHRHGHTRML